MAKISKTAVDKALREQVFDLLFSTPNDDNVDFFVKINDRQYGVLLTDLNGVQRYIRVGAIVAEERDDMTAEELMQSEIDAYNLKQAEKAEKARKRAEKAEKDKARRKAEAKAKESEQE